MIGWPSRRPPHRVGMVLRIGCGSLDERDDERGFAHLLEHLAFRGSRHFPAGALPAFFESLGTRLGHHQNASTSFDHTRFALNLPRADGDAFERALLCLADFAWGLRFTDEAIDSERQVVAEEMRARRGGETNVRATLLDTLMAGTPVPARHPLGDPESLRAASPERIAAFYARHYRPDDAWLLVAGDFDEARLGAQVRSRFEAWPAATTALPDKALHPSPQRARALVVREAELGEAEAALLWLQAPAAVRDARQQRGRVVSRVALALIQRRLAGLALDGAPFRQARIGITRLMRGWESVKVLVQGDEARLDEMLGVVASELGAVIADGFSADELALACEATLAAAREGVVTAAERDPGSVAAEIEEAEADDRTWLPPREHLALLEATLPQLASPDLTRALAGHLRLEAPLLFAAVPGRADTCWGSGDLLRRVTTAVPRSAAARPAPPPVRLLPREPAASPPVEVTDHPRLGTRDAWLRNGVRLHCRSMPTAGRVFVQLALFGGRVCESEEDLGLTAAAALAWQEPTTRELSPAALADYMALRRLALEVVVDEDCVRLGLAVAPENLRAGLELLLVLLDRPRVAPASFARWRAERLAEGDRQHASLDVAVGSEALRLLSGGDPRFRAPSARQWAALDAARTAAWLSRIAGGPLHAAIVGDVAHDVALEAGSTLLGALPARPRHSTAWQALRSLSPAAGPQESRLRSSEPRSAVLCGWRSLPWARVPERHYLALAETIAGERLQRELREVRGLTYTASCSHGTSRAYPAASLFATTLLCAPGRGPAAAAAAHEVVARLAAEGPTGAEFGAARTEYEILAQRATDSGPFWARLLAEGDERAVAPADVLDLQRQLATCRGTDVRDALRAVVREERRITVIADS